MLSKLKMRFINCIEMTISSKTGTLPPTNPVLPPCGTMASRWDEQYLRISETSQVVLGRNTSLLAPGWNNKKMFRETLSPYVSMRTNYDWAPNLCTHFVQILFKMAKGYRQYIHCVLVKILIKTGSIKLIAVTFAIIVQHKRFFQRCEQKSYAVKHELLFQHSHSVPALPCKSKQGYNCQCERFH